MLSLLNPPAPHRGATKTEEVMVTRFNKRILITRRLQTVMRDQTILD